MKKVIIFVFLGIISGIICYVFPDNSDYLPGVAYGLAMAIFFGIFESKNTFPFLKLLALVVGSIGIWQLALTIASSTHGPSAEVLIIKAGIVGGALLCVLAWLLFRNFSFLYILFGALVGGVAAIPFLQKGDISPLAFSLWQGAISLVMGIGIWQRERKTLTQSPS